MSKTVVISGSQGFIGSYICNELLSNGYKVIGIDNYSKYGKVIRNHDSHHNFTLVEHDLSKSFPNIKCDYLIAGAAMIGGISYFHTHQYDLLEINERIIANTMNHAVIHKRSIKRVIVLSSSMVYENAVDFPSKESDVSIIPPPNSTYGFQKLATEYFAKGAAEQYGVPYTIIRPFNAVGIGEDEALGEEEVYSGNIKLMMSHVLPDIVNKILLGQNPLHILGSGMQIRCYTNGKDIARGVRIAMESSAAINESFNISNPNPITVLELARRVWEKIYYSDLDNYPFKYAHDKPYTYDVHKRIPCTKKAEKILNFKAIISLDQSIEEVINYMRGNRIET